MPTHTPGRFVWHELFTPNVQKSKRWYGELFGWTYEDAPVQGMTYTMIKAGGAGVGGFMSLDILPKGVPAHWLAYVSADPDAVAKGVQEGGGQVLKEPFDIPDVGRMVVFQDPTGGVLAGFRGNKGDEPEVERPSLGTFCWDQLNTSDPEKAKAFYQKAVGWTTRAFATPGLEVFVREGDRDTASIMQAPGGAPTHWLAYVVVDKLEEARAVVKRLGGLVWLEHQAVPGVGAISVVADADGATIGLFEPQS